ncbi:hypothetical protein Sjap_019132 [Stephania japonica]|uniref:F-box domain-containing protein n=1 Tax=Stephania japonica TaxID=461633 RepID=A0AAP0HUF8_9MAGN
MIGSRSAGLCLLPSELIQDILLRLPLPELLRLKSVSKTLFAVISADDFRRECNSRSISDTWLFVYKKRSPRDSGLHGFSYRSARWFKISSVAGLLSPGEDLFLLAASGDFFLFASNNRAGGDLIAVNLTLRTAKKLPHCPLGPRGTSSWRRSGLKLISGPAGSDRFRFLFAELHENRPVLLEYFSESDSWRCVQAREYTQQGSPRGVFLSVVHRRNDSVLLAASGEDDEPVIVRPRFDAAAMDDLAIGFSSGGRIKRLHVFGDGYVTVVRSESVSGSEKERVMTWIEVQGLSVDGRSWEFVSSAPSGLIPKKAYVAMTGCIEERDGVVRVVLMMSNWEGLWEIVWLSFDLRSKVWKWVPLPECRMKGSNMAGMTLSSGLTLR